MTKLLITSDKKKIIVLGNPIQVLGTQGFRIVSPVRCTQTIYDNMGNDNLIFTTLPNPGVP